jgi:Phage tail sheath protein subtilisin-like domain/Phage tail sheath C-terminal domain
MLEVALFAPQERREIDMPEMILPGVYIEVRPEGLIIPGQVTVGNIGIVGTASKGPISVPTLLGSYAEALQKLGPYDQWLGGTQNELTLVRALQLAYIEGATTVWAVRVTGTHPQDGTPKAGQTTATPAQIQLNAANGDASVKLTALTEGTWGNSLSVTVQQPADQNAIVQNEKHDEGAPIKLKHIPIQDARTRIQFKGRSLSIVYTLAAGQKPLSGQVYIDTTTGTTVGELTFHPGEEPKLHEILTATYAVDKSNAFNVTLRLGRAEEVYSVVNGHDLAEDIGTDPSNTNSALVYATELADPNDPLKPSGLNAADSTPIFTPFLGGEDGADAQPGDYQNGLDTLLYQNVQIMIAAGQDDSFGNRLDAHCQKASTDVVKRDRIAVVGSGTTAFSKNNPTIDKVLNHNLDSDRVIFVTPGIKTSDDATATEVTLPGAYTAAAVAGLLASFPAHISLTNKVLDVDGLEEQFKDVELTQLLQARVMPVEVHLGFHIVRGITTSTNTAFQQITTRRIVDYAKYGVRSAAQPYIGLLNNERVRGALRATINSFLAQMVNDEMLISYDLDVTATRDQEIRGIVQVTMTLSPVFSIDFIQVTMFLE